MIDRELSIVYAPGTAFKGKLSSSVDDCMIGKVVVYRKRRGEDKRIGSDGTSPRGGWTVTKSHARAGRYYATTARTTLGPNGICPKVASPTIRVD